MKYKLVSTMPNEFFLDKKGPLVSIYQKTSRISPTNKKDSLVFKNLVKEIELSLKENYTNHEIRPLIEMFELLIKDQLFWRHNYEGIALFATLDECIIYKLKKKMTNLAVVADSFHTKPLLEYFQFNDTYQILDIDGKSFRLFEASPYHLEEIKLNGDIPTTMEELLGDKYTESYLTHGVYGGLGNTMYHGHGGKQPEIDIDLERFFRLVDAIVLEKVSKVSKLPLILLAPQEYHSVFRGFSNNTYMELEALEGTYELLGPAKIKSDIKRLVKTVFDKKVASLITEFHQSKTKDKSSDQLDIIIPALLTGRVSVLMIEKDKIIPGTVDVGQKKFISGEIKNPKTGDVLDDLAQLALNSGGKVYVLKKNMMPSVTGIAAIFRY